MTATAVLLPLRIETVLDPPVPGVHEGWVLRLRLIPDVVSIVPEDDTSPVEREGNATANRDWASVVRGIPPLIRVVVQLDDGHSYQLALHPDASKLTLPSTTDELAEAIGLDDLDPGTERPWWLSYSGSEKVGLAGAIELGDTPDGIVAIYAFGVGTEHPDAVFAGHAQHDQLFRVPIGTPTNAVDGAVRATLRPVKPTEVAGLFDLQRDDRERLMLTALWPALYADALEHVFGVKTPWLDSLCEWAGNYLAPGGMHEAIAVRSVPYGVFAATVLPRLEPLAADPLSTDMGPTLLTLLDLTASAAEAAAAGSVDIETDLVTRIAQLSDPMRFRLRGARDVLGTSFDPAYLGATDRLSGSGLIPSVRHLFPAQGSEPYLRPAFVLDGPEKEYFFAMREALWNKLGQFPGGLPAIEMPHPARQVSLFVKLLDRSIRSEVDRNTAEAMHRLEHTAKLLDLFVDAGDVEWVEPTFRRLVGAAAERIDPWIVGIAEQRLHLKQLSGGDPPVLGVYGWVDGPIRPAPLVGSYLLAPSAPQAVVGAVALDRFLTDGDPDPKRWAMNLTSRSIRVAEELAQELRAGGHLAEVLGRRLERWADERLRHDLRAAYPRRAAGSPRRSVDGARVLAAWRSSGTLSVGPLSEKLTDELDSLVTALDTYADLLILDGLHHVLDGRPELAKASLDASAGIGTPPSLDVLRTPRVVSDTRTVVVGTVPFVAVDAGAGHPYALADPSMHGYLSALAPAAADVAITATVESPPAIHTVSLADLGVDAVTAVTIPQTALHGAATAHLGLTDAQVTEPDSLVELRQRARLFAGSIPTAHSGDSIAVDDASELRARLVALAAHASQVETALRGGSTTGGLGFGLVVAEETRVTAADQLATRLADAQRTLAETPDDAISIARALRALLGAEESVPLSRGAQLPARQPPTQAFLLDWLGALSAVREPIARLDAALLHAQLTLSTSAADGWARNGDPQRTLVVTAGPVGVHSTAGVVAAVVLDSFAESIPSVGHDAAAALHFDAPTTRAPQAILIAVGPSPDREEFRARDLLAVTQETRRLAHARMFRLANDPVLAAVAPTTVYPPYPGKPSPSGNFMGGQLP